VSIEVLVTNPDVPKFPYTEADLCLSVATFRVMCIACMLADDVIGEPETKDVPFHAIPCVFAFALLLDSMIASEIYAPNSPRNPPLSAVMKKVTAVVTPAPPGTAPENAVLLVGLGG